MLHVQYYTNTSTNNYKQLTPAGVRGLQSHQGEIWAVSQSCSTITASVLLLLSSVSSISMVIWGTWQPRCHQIGAGQAEETKTIILIQGVCGCGPGTWESEKCSSVQVPERVSVYVGTSMLFFFSVD